MKDVQIDESIQRDKKLFREVERANRILDNVVGPSDSEISARWSVHSQRLGRLIQGALSDGTTMISTNFRETDLSRMTDSALRRSLNGLWGDLLQEQSHRQMEKLNLIMQELGKD